MIEAHRPARTHYGRRDPGRGPLSPEERIALWLQLGLTVALEVAFLVAGWTLFKYLPALGIEPWQKVAFQVGLGAAFLVFGVRARALWRRLQPHAPRPS